MANFVGTNFSLPSPRTNTYVKINSLTFTHSANATTTVTVTFTVNLRDQTHLGIPWDLKDQSWARIARLVINGTETSTQMIKSINQVWNIGMTQQFTLSWTLPYVSGTVNMALDIIENASSGSAMNFIVWRTPRTGYTYTIAAATGPTAPRNITITPTTVTDSNANIVLSWTAPSNIGTSNQLTYQIYRREVGSSDVYLQEVPSSTLSLTKKASAWGIVSGKSYTFTVLARTSYGTASAGSGTVSFIPAPTAPPNIKLIDPQSIAHAVEMSWDAATAPLSSIAKYTVILTHKPVDKPWDTPYTYVDVPASARSYSFIPNQTPFPTAVLPGSILSVTVEAVNAQGLRSAISTWVYSGALKGAILYVKVNGTWRRGNLYVRQSGSWKQGLRLKVKQSDLWKDSK